MNKNSKCVESAVKENLHCYFYGSKQMQFLQNRLKDAAKIDSFCILEKWFYFYLHEILPSNFLSPSLMQTINITIKLFSKSSPCF